MAYIAPNSTIKLFSGVPLDNTYRNTLYFANEAAQLSYFASAGAGLVATLNSQMYQRVSQGICKVELSFGTAYTVNYMAFKNTDFENKWFYAFVNDVKYINNGVCEIDYEIDVMQTFLFDVDLLPCLVEREHANTDNIGDNILPEQFDVGEYKLGDMRELVTGLTNCWIILGMTDDKSSKYADPSPGAAVKTILDVGLYDATMPEAYAGFHDGVYSGLKYYAFDGTPTGAAELTAFINAKIKTVDNIYCLYMAPKCLLPNYGNGAPGQIIVDPDAGTISDAYVLDPNQTSDELDAVAPAVDAVEGSYDYKLFDNYLPMNKKLYTYPYNFYGVTNGQGSGLVLRFEWFTNFTPKFYCTTTFVSPVTIVMRPHGYKNIIMGNFPDMNESLTLTNYPQCSWSYDTYSRWIAAQLPQEKRAMLTQGITSGLKMITGAVMAAATGGAGIAAAYGAGSMVNAGIDLINKTASLYEKRYEAAIAQDPLKGNSANGNADFGSGLLGFYGYRGHVSGEVAKEIDEYFSIFGYQTNKVKVPNRTGRAIYNYVKTANCTLVKTAAGKVTAADISQMEAIYDNGITFWHDPSQVGNYTSSNMRTNVPV